MSEDAQLDRAAVDRLQRLGGNEFVGKMIDLFSGYAAEKLAAAQQAHAAGNLTAVADAVHPIKSSAGNVGAIRVQQLAKQIEELARQSKADTLPQLLEELQRAFDAARCELDQVKASLAGSAGGAQ